MVFEQHHFYQHGGNGVSITAPELSSMLPLCHRQITKQKSGLVLGTTLEIGKKQRTAAGSEREDVGAVEKGIRRLGKQLNYTNRAEGFRSKEGVGR